MTETNSNTSQTIAMFKPLVAVVTTTFNHETTIIKALEGVINQKCTFNIEFIIANDCSTDGTDEVVNAFLKTATIPANIVVRYTKHKVNKGMMRNVVWTLKQVQAKYIALCEGDDYWIDPLKLQKQVDFLEKNENFGLVHTNYKIYHAKTNKCSEHKPYQNESRTDENEYYLKTGDMRTCTVLFRARFLADFRDLLKQDFMKNTVLGDRPFFLLISRLSKIHFINEVTSVYYVTAQNSASHFADFFRYYEFLKKVSEVNIALLQYLKIEDMEYIKSQQRKINFYEVLLNFQNKNTWSAIKMLSSKTGRYFWNKKELMEVYGMIRHNITT